MVGRGGLVSAELDAAGKAVAMVLHAPARPRRPGWTGWRGLRVAPRYCGVTLVVAVTSVGGAGAT